jgi:hypothetical protein
MIINGLILHKGQERLKNEIINSDCKFYIINASRQSGKTTLLEQLLLYYALNFDNQTILFVAPIYSNTKKSFTTLLNNLLESGVIKDFSRADQQIFFINGSSIHFRSASNYDNIRGGSYEYVFIDEFAFINPDAWTEVIRQTMAVKGKKAFLSSTPKGKNLFYELAMRGQSEDHKLYKYLYMNYLDNPFYDLQEIEDARNNLPDSVFRQEYLAEFIDDGGSVFTNLKSLSIIDRWGEPDLNTNYFAGLDLGKQVDYTVLTIMDEYNNVVFIYRDNNKPWNIIVNNVVEILRKWKPLCFIEVNSIGDPIYEQIKKLYKDVRPFITTSRSKEDIIENLIYAFNKEDIKLPSRELFEYLYNELSIFTFEYNRSTRNIKYNAPLGFHDDCVMSLAICYFARLNIKKNKVHLF